MNAENKHSHSGSVPEESSLRRIRIEKLSQIENLGINPYPDFFDQTHHSTEIKTNPELLSQEVSIAGRVVSIRKMGKVNFAHIQDQNGQVQIFLQTERVGEDKMSFFNKFIDLGDIIGVRGNVFITKTKEVTVNTDEYILLSKSLRPLPSAYYGLKDQETIYRERYLDILMNPEAKTRFEIRRRLIKSTRDFLDRNDFVEVETPILQSEVSGATAKPFITHHNALDMNFYLRIAPETYLKRLLVGGYERVYEIGRNFRNEGIDASHLQDFTMLEFYASYWNASTNISFTHELVRHIAINALGQNFFVLNGEKVDLDSEWPIRKYRDVLLKHSGIDIYEIKDAQDLSAIIEERGIKIEDIRSMNKGQIIDKLFKLTTRPNLIEPQFIVEYPVLLSPLARSIEEKPDFVDQFQLLIGGWEVVKGYSELINPIEQKRRLTEQARLKSEGDEEAMSLDDEYIKAMEYGMPPNSGVGIGIDRLTAILTGTGNLRDVVFFPLTKPK